MGGERFNMAPTDATVGQSSGGVPVEAITPAQQVEGKLGQIIDPVRGMTVVAELLAEVNGVQAANQVLAEIVAQVSSNEKYGGWDVKGGIGEGSSSSIGGVRVPGSVNEILSKVEQIALEKVYVPGKSGKSSKALTSTLSDLADSLTMPVQIGFDENGNILGVDVKDGVLKVRGGGGNVLTDIEKENAVRVVTIVKVSRGGERESRVSDGIALVVMDRKLKSQEGNKQIENGQSHQGNPVHEPVQKAANSAIPSEVSPIRPGKQEQQSLFDPTYDANVLQTRFTVSRAGPIITKLNALSSPSIGGEVIRQRLPLILEEFGEQFGVNVEAYLQEERMPDLIRSLGKDINPTLRTLLDQLKERYQRYRPVSEAMRRRMPGI